jgi:cell division protein FtsI (penicillin-binding protein 3)
VTAPSRLGVVHIALALFFVAIAAKGVQVQIINGSAWRARASRQQTATRDIPSPRGRVLDESGRIMAQNQEKVRLDVTPREVRELARLKRVLAGAKVPARVVALIADTSLQNVAIPGVFLRFDVAPALGMRGVHPSAFVERVYSTSRAARQIIGRVDVNGRATDGIEAALDGTLKGKPGVASLVQDVRRRTFESPTAPGIAPTEGNTVVLTINQDLQEIAENALMDAISKMGATSGDIVILDPHSGEIRAMASRRGDSTVTAAALTEPFEPGSTLKPFIAAGLLERGLVKSSDSVDTGNGQLTINNRTIHDDHPIGRAPLSDVIRMSSNVGIVMFAERLSRGDEFETLRDFGFGTATGIEFPSESSGSLRAPTGWGSQSPNSIAMGYEIAVTPLQLAVAYAAFANGGKLLEPTLVKEVRSPDGKLRYQHSTHVVRQVVSAPVALEVREMLKEVVESGTASSADMGSYVLAGKTGTPRGTVNGHYVAGKYNPNFVGLFPADDPQYVIAVRLSNPAGSYYGGKTAAPVTRAVIEAAVASPRAALDRGRLAASVRPIQPPREARLALRVSSAAERTAETLSVVGPDAGRASSTVTEPVVVTLPAGSASVTSPEPARPVPSVRGLSVRNAVRTLHRAGFRVDYAGSRGGAHAPTATVPAAGSIARPGSLVRLIQSP